MLESLDPPKTLRITVFVVGVLVPKRSLSKTLGVVSVVVLTVIVKVSSLAMRVFMVGVVGELVVEVLVSFFGKRTTVAVAVAQGAFPLSGQSW